MNRYTHFRFEYVVVHGACAMVQIIGLHDCEGFEHYSSQYVALLRRQLIEAGFVEQDAERIYLSIDRTITYSDAEKGIDIPGWQPQTVTYTKEFDVSTSKGRIFSAYPKARTREHFMTVSFQRPAGGGLRLTANAWRVRERHGPKNLPKRDFAKPYTIDLA